MIQTAAILHHLAAFGLPDIFLPQNSSISRDYMQLLVLPWARESWKSG
jgi:hypothetical protein